MGPSSCVGTLGPIDHSPYTVPTLSTDPGPPRNSLQPIVGLAKGDRLETPNNTVRIDRAGSGGRDPAIHQPRLPFPPKKSNASECSTTNKQMLGFGNHFCCHKQTRVAAQSSLEPQLEGVQFQLSSRLNRSSLSLPSPHKSILFRCESIPKLSWGMALFVSR